MPQPRRYWEGISVKKIYKIYYNTVLVVVLTSSEPSELESKEARDQAIKSAKKRGFHILSDESDVHLYGQNCAPDKQYYFKK